MIRNTRRTFLGTLGTVLAFGAGTNALAPLARRRTSGGDTLHLGRFDALATRIQETPADDLQQHLIERLRGGLALEDLVAATCLANARAFGGHDYDAYHCLMAMMPAYEMARELDGEARWLPVLKVVHRTARCVEGRGGRKDALHALAAARELDTTRTRAELRDALRARDVDRMEAAFHGRCAKDARVGLHDVQSVLRETLDVHRIVLTWRSWDALQLTGEEHAETLLRQSLRWFADAEERRAGRRQPEPPLRTLLPKLIADTGLDAKKRNERAVSDEELEDLAAVVFAADKDDAAEAVARALADGWSHSDAGEALTLAANRLLLNDPGRRSDETPEKPKGSVHGASVGVHACDAARAWRNLASVSDRANSAANLIAGAYHTAGQAYRVEDEPFPFAEELGSFERCKPDQLARALGNALGKRDQRKASAALATAEAKSYDPEPLFATLHAAALASDGALHAEKFYRTVREDFASSRPAHRWRHLIALARVCASQHGYEAPGFQAARDALKS